MRHFLMLTVFICICWLAVQPADAKRRKTTTSTTPTTSTTEPATLNTEEDNEESVTLDEGGKVPKYHPAEVLKPRVLEQMDRRYRDGNFEYNPPFPSLARLASLAQESIQMIYVLSNGVSRYEKSYWIPVGDTKLLARKGYYSYPLKNSNKYLTVFYTADEHGYQEDSSKYTNNAPVLPRALAVPVHEFPTVTSSSTTTTQRTTRKPKATRTTRKSWAAAKDF